MKEYFLCDIHFHTNNSFDAFRSTAFSVSNLSAIFKGTSVVDDLKLVCFTDHNYFNYNDYVTNYAGFKANGILCLPGIEINTTNKIHWIFIFNDNQLAGTNDSGQKYGMLLENAIYNFYGYNNAISILKQTYTAQNTPVSLEKFLDEINYLGIEFIAIPHFDKSCGGWFKHLKKDPEQLKLLDLFIRDNIIFGVESKQIKEFIKKNMEDTQFHLNSYLESFEKLDENISDEEKRKALEEIDKRRQHLLKMCKIKNCVDKTSVIYGSDYHGDGAYDKSNLFIMKSELSFEGLKFALLDFDSRIFSIDKYAKCLKTNNYVINNIVIRLLTN